METEKNLFFINQSENNKESYKFLLKIAGSLSRLFSNNESAFLHYRIAENIFCKAFKAKNLSRSDCSIDALTENKGFVLKTKQ